VGVMLVSIFTRSLRPLKTALLYRATARLASSAERVVTRADAL
jgi:hypothetical protein